MGLIALIEPHYPKTSGLSVAGDGGDGGDGADSSNAELIWLQRSMMEELLYETTIMRHFTRLHLDRTPGETKTLGTC